jgi:hypothetical protein
MQRVNSNGTAQQIFFIGKIRYMLINEGEAEKMTDWPAFELT